MFPMWTPEFPTDARDTNMADCKALEQGKRGHGVCHWVFTQLLHENTGHFLRQDPAGMDESRQVTPCTELHDEVDIVIVPLWLEVKRQLQAVSLLQPPLEGTPSQAQTWKSFSCTI